MNETSVPVAERLRMLIERYAGDLVVAQDDATMYRLVTRCTPYKKKPLEFAAVRCGKKDVAFHLFALYLWPALADDVSADLSKRRTGKTCFTFAKVDEAAIAALDALVACAHAAYERTGFLEADGARAAEAVATLMSREARKTK